MNRPGFGGGPHTRQSQEPRDPERRGKNLEGKDELLISSPITRGKLWSV